MIIVIQDKSVIVNLENLEGIVVDDNKNEIIARTALGFGVLLGEYETRERALEVVEQITESYQKTQFYKYGSIGDRNYIIETLDDLFMYKMPEK